jgi:hypothetical protein
MLTLFYVGEKRRPKGFFDSKEPLYKQGLFYHPNTPLRSEPEPSREAAERKKILNSIKLAYINQITIL